MFYGSAVPIAGHVVSVNYVGHVKKQDDRYLKAM